VDRGFRPCLPLRNPHLQSFLASSQLRVFAKRFVLKHSEERIVATPAGSRLLSIFSRHPEPKGLVILLHGWEGSSSSAYMIDAGAFYYRLGFSVCRLNLRDHGESHHLNEGLFHGALIEETFDAVDIITGLVENKPVYLIGFSLGGNFALRIARKYSALGRGRLQGVFAVSPPLDPYKSTVALDNGHAIYRHYFLEKWKRSLRKKQKLFPDRYDFGRMLEAKTCIELTDEIMPYFPGFRSYREYFNLYTLKDEFFRDFKIPVNIFIADDDPIISREDYDAVSEHDNFRIFRPKYGGHCGFIDFFPHRCWYNKVIADIID
jgi:predicted alpha/beta-fold hydrolase